MYFIYSALRNFHLHFNISGLINIVKILLPFPISYVVKLFQVSFFFFALNTYNSTVLEISLQF